MGRRGQSTPRQMVGRFCLFQARRGRDWAETGDTDDGAVRRRVIEQLPNSLVPNSSLGTLPLHLVPKLQVWERHPLLKLCLLSWVKPSISKRRNRVSRKS